MKNGDIPNENIKASSFEYIYYSYKARLNGPSTWGADYSAVKPWVQADIGYQTYISGVITQGDGGAGSIDWVTAIKISTFAMTTNDPETFVADENGQVIVSFKTGPYFVFRNRFKNVCMSIRIVCIQRRALAPLQ